MGPVLQIITVHQSDPSHQPHVVDLDFVVEDLFLIHALDSEEGLDVDGIKLGLLLKRTYLAEEISWVELQVVVEDQNGAVLLEFPDGRIQFGVFIFSEEFTIDRIVNKEGHVFGLRLNVTRL